MEAFIELRRSKNLGLGVFVVVGVAVYLTEKFAGEDDGRKAAPCQACK